MPSPHPMLYQINTRVWMTDLASGLGSPATLDDAPNETLDRLQSLGFDWVWLLGVWRIGEVGRKVSRTHSDWQDAFRRALPDLSATDICGSCFAINAYTVAENLGGADALLRFRDRLHQRGMKLMLDFVPNHMAPDHPWVTSQPGFFVQGTEELLASEPQNYVRLKSADGLRIFAHGRDPYFSGWPDTVQLDYANPDLQAAMRAELMMIARLCDGVRCDMAMLVLPEIFERTWGRRADPFWPDAISSVRWDHTDFLFMAEVYWDKEWELQQQGFDYAYDKRLYDRLRDRSATGIRDHLIADLNYQNKLARFLENHDEPRAAATFSDVEQEAAAVVTYFTPGLRFFYDGQFEGKKVHVPPHLCRAPQEPENDSLKKFYERLVPILDSSVVRNGNWKALACAPVGSDGTSFHNMIAYAIEDENSSRLIVIVNYAPKAGECRLPLPFDDFHNGSVTLSDLLTDDFYRRDGSELTTPGLHVILPAWGHHVLSVEVSL